MGRVVRSYFSGGLAFGDVAPKFTAPATSSPLKNLNNIELVVKGNIGNPKIEKGSLEEVFSASSPITISRANITKLNSYLITDRLFERLDDPHVYVRQAAALALGEIAANPSQE